MCELTLDQLDHDMNQDPAKHDLLDDVERENALIREIVKHLDCGMDVRDIVDGINRYSETGHPTDSAEVSPLIPHALRELADELERRGKEAAIREALARVRVPDEQSQLRDLMQYGVAIRKLPTGERIDPPDFQQSRSQWETKGRLR